MMVNFICQVDWAIGHLGIWLNIISVCICDVFPEDINSRVGGVSSGLSPWG
jgi:hypothetical protein